MKTLTFGTCQLLQLFDKNVNNTFLESIHYSNKGNYGGENIIALTHDINQVIFILNLLLNNTKIDNSWDKYNLFQKFSVFNQNWGDYRENYLSVQPEYNVNNSILNIRNQIHDIDYIIIEVSTLKKKVIDNVPLFYDINDNNLFNKINDDEFNNDFDILINLIKTINPKIKVLFVSHIIKYNNENIIERVHILNLLQNNINKYNNCHVISPCDYINNDDLEDNRHYTTSGIKKMINALCEKIIDIESSNIVSELNYTGILKFNIIKFLNKKQKDSFKNIDNTLNKMIQEIENNNIKKKYNDNKYLYSVNNYLSEPYNINNKIFIDFFNLMLSKIIIKIAEKYLESSVYIYNALMAVNYNSINERTQSQNWHRDPGGLKIIKFFIFFDDVDENNGALEYIKNSQYTSKNRLTNLFENNGESIYPITYEGSQYYEYFKNMVSEHRYIVECNNGDCVPIDTSGFHRAGFVEPKKYRKYLHVLFLTKNQILNNKDPHDLYQNGFNYNVINNIDIYNIDNCYEENVSQYFYNKSN